MVPHLPLPVSSGRCGDNGDATSHHGERHDVRVKRNLSTFDEDVFGWAA
jgi:hypothetical protein